MSHEPQTLSALDRVRAQRDTLKEILNLVWYNLDPELRARATKMLNDANAIPYPFCLTPAKCAFNGYCKRDRACDD